MYLLTSVLTRFEPTWSAPYRSTPSLRSEITHLTVNPTWTVPPTIYREDSLPKIRDDTGYLYRQNMSVLNLRGQRLDPQQIDWRNPGSIMLRQDPGPTNALGHSSQVVFGCKASRSWHKCCLTTPTRLRM